MRREGFVLVTVLILLLVLLVAAGMASYIVRKEIKIDIGLLDSVRARNAAESGIDLAIVKIENEEIPANCTEDDPSCSFSGMLDDGVRYQVTVAAEGDGSYKIISKGFSGEAEKVIVAIVKPGKIESKEFYPFAARGKFEIDSYSGIIEDAPVLAGEIVNKDYLASVGFGPFEETANDNLVRASDLDMDVVASPDGTEPLSVYLENLINSYKTKYPRPERPKEPEKPVMSYSFPKIEDLVEDGCDYGNLNTDFLIKEGKYADLNGDGVVTICGKNILLSGKVTVSSESSKLPDLRIVANGNVSTYDETSSVEVEGENLIFFSSGNMEIRNFKANKIIVWAKGDLTIKGDVSASSLYLYSMGSLKSGNSAAELNVRNFEISVREAPIGEGDIVFTGDSTGSFKIYVGGNFGLYRGKWIISNYKIGTFYAEGQFYYGDWDINDYYHYKFMKPTLEFDNISDLKVRAKAFPGFGDPFGNPYRYSDISKYGYGPRMFFNNISRGLIYTLRDMWVRSEGWNGEITLYSGSNVYAFGNWEDSSGKVADNLTIYSDGSVYYSVSYIKHVLAYSKKTFFYGYLRSPTDIYLSFVVYFDGTFLVPPAWNLEVFDGKDYGDIFLYSETGALEAGSKELGSGYPSTFKAKNIVFVIKKLNVPSLTHPMYFLTEDGGDFVLYSPGGEIYLYGQYDSVGISSDGNAFVYLPEGNMHIYRYQKLSISAKNKLIFWIENAIVDRSLVLNGENVLVNIGTYKGQKIDFADSRNIVLYQGTDVNLGEFSGIYWAGEAFHQREDLIVLTSSSIVKDAYLIPSDTLSANVLILWADRGVSIGSITIENRVNHVPVKYITSVVSSDGDVNIGKFKIAYENKGLSLEDINNYCTNSTTPPFVRNFFCEVKRLLIPRKINEEGEFYYIDSWIEK